MTTDPHPLGAAALFEHELDQLEKVAKAAEEAQPGPWETSDPGGSRLMRIMGPMEGDADDMGRLVTTWPHIADVIDAGDFEATAEHIATFDPPTVLKLIALARRPTAPSQEGEKPRMEMLVDAEWLARKIASDPDDAECEARPAKPVDGEVERLNGLVERLTREAEQWAQEARCHKSSLHEAYQAVTGGKGEPGNWNGAQPIINELNRLRALVAALPLGGEDMADLSKTDRLSGSLISDVGYEERADLCREIEATLSAFPMHNSKNEGFYRAKASVLRRALEILRTQGTTPPPSADKSGDA